MMCEWRVFYPAARAHEVDVWELLQTRAHGGSPERRTDVYVVCSALAGVKLRGRRLLEVKLRAGRHGNGAEKWEKVLHTKSRWDGRDVRRLGRIVADAISQQRGWISRHKEGDGSELSRGLEDVTALGGREDIKMIPLNKSRVRQHMPGVAVEQTNITVDGQPGEVWRSVCVEGKVPDIVKLLDRKVQAGGRQERLGEYLVGGAVGGVVCGYPEFIVNLQQRIDESKASS